MRCDGYRKNAGNFAAKTFGINPERLQLEWISAAEGVRFAETMKRVETIRRSVTQEELSEASNIFSNKKYM